MALLEIRLLGTPEFIHDGRPLSFRTRKVLALLVYLVVEGGIHSRDSLMTLLWPETEAAKSAATLRGTLSRLRRAVEPAGNTLVTAGGKVGIRFETCPVDLDLAWFEAAAASGDSLQALAPIFKIDRGNFLDGFSLPDAPGFDSWVTVQRQWWRRQVESAYDRLSRLQLEMGNGGEAAKTAGRWLVRAPLNELAYRRLMSAEALAGDRAAALKTFAQCRTLLQAELGIEPAPETVELARQIADSEAGRDSARSNTVLANRQATSASRPLLLPFVGRGDEHRQLAAAFAQVKTGEARLVTVIGAGGVGKTRLVRAFLEWAALDTPGVDVWQGRAFEMGGRLPYEPVIEALRQRLEQENAPEDLLDDVWLAELSQLVPELRARYPDLPPPMSGDANVVRSRLFAAVATLGSALAAQRTSVFVLDDMQWADGDARDMVHYAVRRWAESQTPILLLLTVRQENYAADSTLREWLNRLERDGLVTRLRLGSLSSAAVRELVANLANSATGEATIHAFADWLWAETNGLPFFIQALLQTLLDQDVLTATGSGYALADALRHVRSAGQVPLPPGVRDVILIRLARLSATAASVLLAAAVLGRECRFGRLCQVAGVTEGEGLPALEQLITGRLLAEDGSARRPYNVAHDYIREVVYSASGEARRRVLHRRALISLEADGAPNAECAFHAVASLLDEPAFRYSLAAGDEAYAAYALQECHLHYDRARDALHRAGMKTATISPELIYRLYQHRGRALELSGNFDAAEANYHEMAQVGAEREEPDLRLGALVARCIIRATHTSAFDLPAAKRLGASALELARELDDRAAEAKALWCKMLVEFHAGNAPEPVFDYGGQALSIARELKLTELIGYIQSTLSWVYGNLDELDMARRANDEALSIWQELRNLPMVNDAYVIKMVIQRFSGQYDLLLATARDALRLAESTDNFVHQVMALLIAGDIHGLQGRLGTALDLCERSLRISHKIDNSFSIQGVQVAFISLHLHAGAAELADAWSDKLLALMEEAFMPVFQVNFLARIAQAKVARGKLQEAESVLNRAWESYNLSGSSTDAMTPLFVADAYWQLAQRKPTQALERMEALIEHLIRVPSVNGLAEGYWLQGQALLAQEKPHEARESFVAGRAVAETGRERTILWQILVSLAEVAAQLGHVDEAIALQREARAVVGYIVDHAGMEAMRRTFLSRPRVRRLRRDASPA